MKDKKDKQCRFIFTAAFGHIYQGLVEGTVYIRLFPSASRHQALTGSSSAFNERNACSSSTDNETDNLWLMQKGAFVETNAASAPSLAVLI